MRVCSKCGISKPKSEFYQDRRSKSGCASWCKICKRGYEKQPQARLLDRKRRLKYEYGMTVEEYNDLFITQKGRCGICGKHQRELNRPLDVDHDHATGVIRGLLCNYCNKILERHINSDYFKDPDLLTRIQGYLEYKK